MDTKFTYALILGIIILFSLPSWSQDPCPPDPTEGLNYYFDPVGGSDSNNCQSATSTCKSVAKFQQILDQAKPGNHVKIKAGTTMPISTPVDLRVNGTEVSPIVIESYGEGNKPILDASTIPGGVFILNCKEKDWWTIKGLHFRKGKGAIGVFGCENIIIDDILVTELCQQECIHFKYQGSRPSQNITIRNSTIDVPSRSEGIYIGTDPAQSGGNPDTTRNITIENTTIKNTANGECIEMKDGSSYVTIRGNRFINVGGGSNGCVFSSRASHDSPDGNHVIEGNYFENITGEQGYPIRVRNGATIRFNMINGSTKDGISAEQPSGNPVYIRRIENNTIINSNGAGINMVGAQTTAKDNVSWQNATKNDTQDPLFVNPSNKDFRLRAGSPAIMRGAYPTPIMEGN